MRTKSPKWFGDFSRRSAPLKNQKSLRTENGSETFGETELQSCFFGIQFCGILWEVNTRPGCKKIAGAVFWRKYTQTFFLRNFGDFRKSPNFVSEKLHTHYLELLIEIREAFDCFNFSIGSELFLLTLFASPE